MRTGRSGTKGWIRGGPFTSQPKALSVAISGCYVTDVVPTSQPLSFGDLTIVGLKRDSGRP
jgi:hypothetical protein